MQYFKTICKHEVNIELSSNVERPQENKGHFLKIFFAIGHFQIIYNEEFCKLRDGFILK